MAAKSTKTKGELKDYKLETVKVRFNAKYEDSGRNEFVDCDFYLKEMLIADYMAGKKVDYDSLSQDDKDKADAAKSKILEFLIPNYISDYNAKGSSKLKCENNQVIEFPKGKYIFVAKIKNSSTGGKKEVVINANKQISFKFPNKGGSTSTTRTRIIKIDNIKGLRDTFQTINLTLPEGLIDKLDRLIATIEALKEREGGIPDNLKDLINRIDNQVGDKDLSNSVNITLDGLDKLKDLKIEGIDDLKEAITELTKGLKDFKDMMEKNMAETIKSLDELSGKLDVLKEKDVDLAGIKLYLGNILEALKEKGTSPDPNGTLQKLVEELLHHLEKKDEGFLKHLEEKDKQIKELIETFLDKLKGIEVSFDTSKLEEKLEGVIKAIENLDKNIGGKLDDIADRLKGIESKLGNLKGISIDLTPLLAILKEISESINNNGNKDDTLAIIDRFLTHLDKVHSENNDLIRDLDMLNKQIIDKMDERTKKLLEEFLERLNQPAIDDDGIKKAIEDLTKEIKNIINEKCNALGAVLNILIKAIDNIKSQAEVTLPPDLISKINELIEAIKGLKNKESDVSPDLTKIITQLTLAINDLRNDINRNLEGINNRLEDIKNNIENIKNTSTGGSSSTTDLGPITDLLNDILDKLKTLIGEIKNKQAGDNTGGTTGGTTSGSTGGDTGGDTSGDTGGSTTTPSPPKSITPVETPASSGDAETSQKYYYMWFLFDSKSHYEEAKKLGIAPFNIPNTYGTALHKQYVTIQGKTPFEDGSFAPIINSRYSNYIVGLGAALVSDAANGRWRWDLWEKPFSDDGEISGRVIDLNSIHTYNVNHPREEINPNDLDKQMTYPYIGVKDAKIRVLDGAGQPLAAVDTDDNGFFHVKDLPVRNSNLTIVIDSPVKIKYPVAAGELYNWQNPKLNYNLFPNKKIENMILPIKALKLPTTLEAEHQGNRVKLSWDKPSDKFYYRVLRNPPVTRTLRLTGSAEKTYDLKDDDIRAEKGKLVFYDTSDIREDAYYTYELVVFDLRRAAKTRLGAKAKHLLEFEFADWNNNPLDRNKIPSGSEIKTKIRPNGVRIENPKIYLLKVIDKDYDSIYFSMSNNSADIDLIYFTGLSLKMGTMHFVLKGIIDGKEKEVYGTAEITSPLPTKIIGRVILVDETDPSLKTVNLKTLITAHDSSPNDIDRKVNGINDVNLAIGFMHNNKPILLNQYNAKTHDDTTLGHNRKGIFEFTNLPLRKNIFIYTKLSNGAVAYHNEPGDNDAKTFCRSGKEDSTSVGLCNISMNNIAPNAEAVIFAIKDSIKQSLSANIEVIPAMPDNKYFPINITLKAVCRGGTLPYRYAWRIKEEGGNYVYLNNTSSNPYTDNDSTSVDLSKYKDKKVEFALDVIDSGQGINQQNAKAYQKIEVAPIHLEIVTVTNPKYGEFAEFTIKTNYKDLLSSSSLKDKVFFRYYGKASHNYNHIKLLIDDVTLIKEPRKDDPYYYYSFQKEISKSGLNINDDIETSQKATLIIYDKILGINVQKEFEIIPPDAIKRPIEISRYYDEKGKEKEITYKNPYIDYSGDSADAIDGVFFKIINNSNSPVTSNVKLEFKLTYPHLAGDSNYLSLVSLFYNRSSYNNGDIIIKPGENLMFIQFKHNDIKNFIITNNISCFNAILRLDIGYNSILTSNIEIIFNI